jgi:hypothetical protein
LLVLGLAAVLVLEAPLFTLADESIGDGVLDDVVAGFVTIVEFMKLDVMAEPLAATLAPV